MSNCERLNAFSLGLRIRQQFLLLPPLRNTVFDVVTTVIRQVNEKEFILERS